MVAKPKAFYCYLDKGEVIVTLIKPDNFETLPYAKIEHVPNPDVARSVYEADLTLIKWRKGEKINE